MKLAIIGCGMLGYDLVKLFSSLSNYEIYCFDIVPQENFFGQKVKKLDITNFDETYKTLTKLNPDIIILTASLTDVDFCEIEKDTAYKINSIGPKNVAIAAQRFDSLVVYISTNFVFDGKKGVPYTEFDTVNPINVYGHSKYLGELFVQQIVNRYLIIRTSWLFGKNRDNYVIRWYNAIVSGKKPVVVKNQYGCPTYTKTLAECIKLLIEKNKLGVYNITNSGEANRLDIVKEIFKHTEKRFNIKKIELVDPEIVFKKAKRPKDTRLQHFVWETEELPKICPWQDAIKDFLKELNGETK